MRAARRRRSLTQEALATLVGITPESISNIERGTQTPSLETMQALTHILDLSFSDLFEAASEAASKSKVRIGLEAELAAMLGGFDDAILKVALQQMDALRRYSLKEPD